MNKELWNESIPEIRAIFQFSFHKFVLTSQNIQDRAEAFIQNGVQLIVGNPKINEHVFKLIRSFQSIFAQHIPFWGQNSNMPQMSTFESSLFNTKPINF